MASLGTGEREEQCSQEGRGPEMGCGGRTEARGFIVVPRALSALVLGGAPDGVRAGHTLNGPRYSSNFEVGIKVRSLGP